MGDDDMLLIAARSRVAALCAVLEKTEGAPVRLIETHTSWVLIARALAYKIKKPVHLPFLDFRTLASRRYFCDEELRLNLRFAPDLYLDIVDVRDGPDGPCFGGAGRLLDFAVRMHRFPDGSLWSERLAAGTLAAAQVDAFASSLADHHRDAAVAPSASAFGSPAVHERVVRQLVVAIDAWQAGAARADPEWPALRRWLDDQRSRLEAHWPGRLAMGRIRECHGDLHLGNVLQLGDKTTAFDAIEFDEELRWIDTLDDLAFLAMDLLAHGRRDFAFLLLNSYLEASGDYDGLPALRFFLVSRALVRSLVAALVSAGGIEAAGGCTAAHYLKLAAALARGSDARLAVTHGLPGSGKTFISQLMLEEVGAVRVRSDVERKRLFGLSALQSSRGRVPGGIYDAATTQQTYSRMLAVAHTALAAGWPTIVDAAFLCRAERAQFAALASADAAPFTILDCRAGLPLLHKRIASRKATAGDASEADAAVLERLKIVDEPLDGLESAFALVIDAEQSPPAAALALRWQEMR